MSKFLFALAALVAMLVAVILGVMAYRYYMNDHLSILSLSASVDPRNAAYTIDGEHFILHDGNAIAPEATTTEKGTSVALFGEPVFDDLDGDKDRDAAALLQKQDGGSGTFYYAVLVMNDGGNARSTNAIFLGDRIAPQTIEIHDGRAIFNYADRVSGEPMTKPPSVGKSLYVRYDKDAGQISEGSQALDADQLSETENTMRKIAESTCIKGGVALGEGTRNRMTKQWWYDANLNATRAHCSAACVVSEESMTAELVWKCERGFAPTSTPAHK